MQKYSTGGKKQHCLTFNGKNIFWPAFGYTQNPKVGQNTRQIVKQKLLLINSAKNWDDKQCEND